MKIDTVCLLLLLIVSRETAESARILGMFPHFGKSHHVVIQPIMETLARAGHEVIVYSPFPLDHPCPNYTHVHLEHDQNLVEEHLDEFVKLLTNLPTWKCLDTHIPVHEPLLHEVFNNGKIKTLLESKQSFDLIVTEPYVGQEFTFIFGHIFNAPTIGIYTFPTSSIINFNTGNSLSLAYIPEYCLPYSDKMSFTERFLNAFSQLRGMYIYYNDYLPTLERKMKTFVPDSPPLLELTRNISLVFVNDHLTADFARPRTPNVIPVAGIHIPPVKPLPKDIKNFMDDASEGVILFCLGSYIKEEALDLYLNVFRKLRQRIILKASKENIIDLPNNVMVLKWVPQRDILAHPKCVLYITHGGLASMLETIYSGVPVVGIPYFSDQRRNVEFFHAKEVGVRVSLQDVSEETISKAIKDVLGNSKYRENMKVLSKIFIDVPVTAAQSVVYWTEYVLRHGGARHLQPASLDLRWYQLALLDVFAVVLAVAIIVGAVTFILLRKIMVLLIGRKNTSSTKKNN